MRSNSLLDLSRFIPGFQDIPGFGFGLHDNSKFSCEVAADESASSDFRCSLPVDGGPGSSSTSYKNHEKSISIQLWDILSILFWNGLKGHCCWFYNHTFDRKKFFLKGSAYTTYTYFYLHESNRLCTKTSISIHVFLYFSFEILWTCFYHNLKKMPKALLIVNMSHRDRVYKYF